MKTSNFKNILFLPLFFVLFLVSCQDEVTEITDPNTEETLTANSNLANLMRFTTSNDGSLDNIIDFANCLEIELPITVIIDGLEITIDSVEDFEVIEAIFDEFDDDDDVLEIIFPIIIILNDYTVIEIENQDALETLIDSCSGEDEDDDDIECIDFVYPITISIYNIDFDVIDTITINNDEALYHFIEDLDGSVLASINFPITMILSDGSTIEVANNTELETAIEAADDSCDEDDDYDWDDDDSNDIPDSDFIEMLTNCTWTVDKLEIDDQDLEDQYNGYVFNFNVDGTVDVTSSGITYYGTWSLVDTTAGIQINLQIVGLSDFNNDNWILHEIEEEDDEFKIDFRNSEDRLRFERHDCSGTGTGIVEDLEGIVIEGQWLVANYNDSGVDETADYTDFVFDFNTDGTVTTTNGTDTISGTWSAIIDSGQLKLVLDFGTVIPFDEFNDDWDVFSLASNRVELRDVSGGSGETDILVFEKL